MLLRPRQEQFVQRSLAALRERGNTLSLAPTGAGKTVMLSAVIPELLEATGKPVLVLQHRDELVTQNRKTFHAFNGTAIERAIARVNELNAKFANLSPPITWRDVWQPAPPTGVNVSINASPPEGGNGGPNRGNGQ